MLTTVCQCFFLGEPPEELVRRWAIRPIAYLGGRRNQHWLVSAGTTELVLHASPIDIGYELISDEQFAKVLGYLESGRSAGAQAAIGGARVGERGYFVQPTVLTHTNPSMSVEREEIFGPVVCAIPFDDPSQILPAANATNYGLAASVFTRDISLAYRTAKRLKAGTVWINTYHVFDAAMPFGGYKESGWGREMGHQVLENYLETKSVVTRLA
jgi:phenylacetaldehyde dehydrogenase